MTPPTEQHYEDVIRALRGSRVVPLLGAGANLCGRPADAQWVASATYLPTGAELAEHLARTFRHPVEDLARVAQAVAVMQGSGELYEMLRDVFDADYAPTTLHRFFARLPAAMRESGSSRPYQLIVTTNYDDLLERAFDEVGEPYDVVRYIAERDNERGKFLHWSSPQVDHEPRLIERPNEYDELDLAERTVILKFHGAVDRVNPERDSFVITEDHYIEYLTRTDITNLVPAELVAKLKRSHFLFLGYALRDWNVRVILHRIWAAQPLDYPSWAIQRKTRPIDERMWRKRNVDIFDVDLQEYVRNLAGRVGVVL